ncbi:hypothetical protein [Piscirickettsia litoralis]|uniref:Uncharacterized protein n=1 Tax=Piscirickettsia litoralis TaxID=1891921 RepID=A0ABX3A0J9_9GAMM|nr:hypothetical protein [Piscirickettsia litoralis]ODN41153.1 hypothetical protein BGC07_17925 [Piscirickettsia litoralis]
MNKLFAVITACSFAMVLVLPSFANRATLSEPEKPLHIDFSKWKKIKCSTIGLKKDDCKMCLQSIKYSGSKWCVSYSEAEKQAAADKHKLKGIPLSETYKHKPQQLWD